MGKKNLGWGVNGPAAQNLATPGGPRRWGPRATASERGDGVSCAAADQGKGEPGCVWREQVLNGDVSGGDVLDCDPDAGRVVCRLEAVNVFPKRECGVHSVSGGV